MFADQVYIYVDWSVPSGEDAEVNEESDDKNQGTGRGHLRPLSHEASYSCLYGIKMLTNVDRRSSNTHCRALRQPSTSQ